MDDEILNKHIQDILDKELNHEFNAPFSFDSLDWFSEDVFDNTLQV